MKSNSLTPKSGLLKKANGSLSALQKEVTIAAVKSTHLEVELATDEGIEKLGEVDFEQLFATHK